MKPSIDIGKLKNIELLANNSVFAIEFRAPFICTASEW